MTALFFSIILSCKCIREFFIFFFIFVTRCTPSINVCFKDGLIDVWGCGTIKIIETCLEAGFPKPELIERDGGFLVTLFKDKFTEEQLAKLGLNQRQMKAVLYVKEKGEITNKEYQQINKISELVKHEILEQAGSFGAGSFYRLITPE